MTQSADVKLPRISVAVPRLDGNERKYVLECIDTTWISSLGRFIGEFETAFATYCGVKHAIAVNNGTTALHLALVAMGIGPGDEVIVLEPCYDSYAPNIELAGGHVRRVPTRRTLNIDPARVEAAITPRTKAIMPVHVYGQSADMDPIMEIARRHGLQVIEDAAEAVGAKYKGRMTGGLGDCATFSFFGNKIITTGEGGMVTTNDDAMAERMRLYRSQGMDPKRRYWFPVVGFNYRMTNIQAAIGLAQLERIEHHLAARRRVADLYNAKLARLGNRLTLPFVEPFAEHVFWMYTVRLSDRLAKSRDQVMLDLDALGIETRPVFYPMHIMPPYEGLGSGPLPMADACSADGMNLPTHGDLTEADIDRIVDALDRVLV